MLGQGGFPGAVVPQHGYKVPFMKDLIQFQNVSFSYNQGVEDTEPVAVLHNVSLSVQEGDFVAVLGHNGSGKSTLAKHIMMGGVLPEFVHLHVLQGAVHPLPDLAGLNAQVLRPMSAWADAVL